MQAAGAPASARFRRTPISRSGGASSTTATRSSCSTCRTPAPMATAWSTSARADVLVAGDIFTTTQYPFIDAKNGGSVQGLIRALNAILDLTVFRHQGEGGTYVVPGHGYLSDEHEVVEYRDMVVIVRDRVKAMKDGGRHAGADPGRAADRRLRHAATAPTAARGPRRCSSRRSTIRCRSGPPRARNLTTSDPDQMSQVSTPAPNARANKHCPSEAKPACSSVRGAASLAI